MTTANGAPRQVANRIGWWLWLLLLILIPHTSSPLLAKVIGRNTVLPLSVVPLALLLLIWILPYLLRGGRLPGLLYPLLAFLLISWIASAASFYLPLFPYKGASVLDRTLRANLSLVVGMMFYLAAAVVSSDEKRLKGSLQALYLGLLFALLYGSLQAWFVLDGKPDIPQVLRSFHRQFLIVRRIFDDRVTAFAFEPSWFADQLLILYLPLTLGSVLRGQSVFSNRRRRISVELFLAIWSVALLILTQSRIGYLSFGLVLAVLCLAGLWRLLTHLRERAVNGSFWARMLSGRWARPVMFTAAILAMLALALAAAIRVSRWDERMERLTSLPNQYEEILRQNPNDAVFEIGNRLAMAERFVYWGAAYRTFERYPLLGVGLGNQGLLFEQWMPDYGYQLTEMQNLLENVNPNLPNAKNLWLRLLSETGLAGFGSYIIWLALLGLGAMVLIKQAGGLGGVIGLAGGLTLLGGLLEGFSLDTFALPHPWIMYGMLTGVMWHLDARRRAEEG